MDIGKKFSRLLNRWYYTTSRRVLTLEGVLPTSTKFQGGRFRLAGRIFLLRSWQSVLEFAIIIFLDPAESFNFLKKRDEFSVCTTSYVEYKLYSKKLRLLSVSGVSAVVMTSLIVSLVTSFVLPGLRSSKAATFTWVQSSWTGVASSTKYAVHPTNQTGWTDYSSKDQTIDVTSVSGKLTSSDAIVAVGSSDSDFASGTTAAYTEITGSGESASVRLKIAR